MTIKWVVSDPLVMNGEPFCYGTRLTVRNILEMRANDVTPSQMLAENPELKVVGIAEAFAFAGQNRERYADFFEADGTLLGPGFTAEEAARLPENLRVQAGIVVSRGEPAPAGAYR
jgi:uncharacterized protein (DUF433 family)